MGASSITYLVLSRSMNTEVRLLSKYPPRIVLLYSLRNWLGGRVFALVLISVAYPLLYGNILLAITFLVFNSIAFWIRPSRRSIERKVLNIHSESGFTPYVTQLAISALIPSLSSVAIYLLDRELGSILLIGVSAILFWNVVIIMTWRGRASIVHGLTYAYPFVWGGVTAIAQFQLGPIPPAGAATISFFVGLLGLLAYSKYEGQEPEFRKMKERYAIRLLESAEKVRTARLTAEDLAHRAGKVLGSRRFLVLDDTRLYLCSQVRGNAGAFLVIDCDSQSLVNPPTQVKQTLWVANFVASNRRGMASALALGFFLPMMDSIWEHRGQSALDNMKLIMTEAGRAKRAATLLMQDMLLEWRIARRYTDFCVRNPTTEVLSGMVERIEEIRPRFAILLKDASSSIVHRDGVNFIQGLNKSLSTIKSSGKLVDLVGPPGA